MHFRLAVIALCATLPLGACFSIPVHKLDIQQGNVVTQEMVDKLKPGMTRAQVRFVLGTPLVTDTFHRNRWDYFYSFKVGAEGVAETRRLTLPFRTTCYAACRATSPLKAGGNGAGRDAGQTRFLIGVYFPFFRFTARSRRIAFGSANNGR